MPSPVLLKVILLVLEQHRFSFISQRGSHVKWRKGNRIVIVPVHGKEVPYGTFRSIVRQAGLKPDDFKM
jgi:predicted RNA binding protein YcfA (HicA-like mRNA interferase family)